MICRGYSDTSEIHKNTKSMNKKHVVIALLVGAALGYVAQNYIRKIPVVNKLPVLG